MTWTRQVDTGPTCWRKIQKDSCQSNWAWEEPGVPEVRMTGTPPECQSELVEQTCSFTTGLSAFISPGPTPVAQEAQTLRQPRHLPAVSMPRIVSANGPADEVQGTSTHNHRKLQTGQKSAQCHKGRVCASPVSASKSPINTVASVFLQDLNDQLLNLMRRGHTNGWTSDLWPGSTDKRTRVQRKF